MAFRSDSRDEFDVVAGGTGSGVVGVLGRE